MVGVAASFIALTAWGLNQYGKLSENSFLYDFLFLISSSVLFYYAYQTNALPFMIVNGAWVVVSLVEVTKDILRRNKK